MRAIDECCGDSPAAWQWLASKGVFPLHHISQELVRQPSRKPAPIPLSPDQEDQAPETYDNGDPDLFTHACSLVNRHSPRQAHPLLPEGCERIERFTPLFIHPFNHRFRWVESPSMDQ